MRPLEHPVIPQAQAAEPDPFDAIEAGFSGFDEPALDIGMTDAPDEMPGRATGGSLGQVRNRGGRALGASSCRSVAGIGTASEP